MKMSRAPVARQFASRLTRWNQAASGSSFQFPGTTYFRSWRTPSLWISAASTPLAYHARSMVLSFLQSARGSSPRCLASAKPYPIRRPRIVAVLLMAYFVTHPAHVVGGNVVERLRVIPRFDGPGDRIAFTPERGPKGLRAVGVRYALERPAPRPLYRRLKEWQLLPRKHGQTPGPQA